MLENPRLAKDVEDLRRRVWLLEQRVGLGFQPGQAAQPPKPEPEVAAIVPPSANREERVADLVNGPAPFGAPAVVSDAKSQALSRLMHPQPEEPQAQTAAQPPTPPVTRPSIIAAARSNLTATQPPPRPPLAPLDAAKRLPKPSAKPKPDFSMERLIGGRWYAWIGALAVVIGIGLFFKLAYDQHWLRLPPNWRCILGAAFGLSLVATGELVKRKINAAAAAGIFAAGIGSIYASTYAAYRLYDLLPNSLALILLAAAAALGILVGARARLVSVTCVSLISGYLTPILMETPHGNHAVLPAFLIALLVVGLTLSAWIRGSFSVLRTLTWWATILMGGLWAMGVPNSQEITAIVFLGLTWLLVHGELLFLSRRNLLISGDIKPPALHWRTWRPLTASFSTTAWTVFLGVKVFDACNAPDWMAPAGVLAAASMLWFALAGNLDSIKDPPRTDSERLGACLGVQSAGLLIATISLALGGWGEVICWLALGVTSIVAGKWLRARAFDIYGIIVLSICALRLLLMDSWMFGMASNGDPLFGFVLTKWVGLMLGAGAAWIAMGLLVRPQADADSPKWRACSNWMIGIGTLLLGASLVHSQAETWTFAAIAATTAILLAFAGRALRSKGLSTIAFAVQVLGALLLLPIHWWDQTSPNAISFLGFYVLPSALVAPYIGLTCLLTPRIAGPTHLDPKGSTQLGLATFITLLAAPLLHTNAQVGSIACAILTTSLVLLFLARLKNSAGLAVYGTIVLTSGTAAALATKWWEASGWGRALGLQFGPEMLALLYAAGAWLVLALAALRLNIKDNEPLARLCTALSTVLLFAAFFHINADLAAITLTWLAISFTAGIFRNLRPILLLDLYMLAGLTAAAVPWIIKYTTDWHTSTSPMLLHPGLGVAILLAGAWLLGSYWSARIKGRASETIHALRALCWLAASGLIFTATTLEVARCVAGLADDPHVRAAAISIWWGIFAVLLVAAGFWKRVTPARHAGLGLLAVAMIKAMVIDLEGVPPIWRIASFIGLGLLMLGVAAVYSKVSSLWGELAAAPSENTITS